MQHKHGRPENTLMDKMIHASSPSVNCKQSAKLTITLQLSGCEVSQW